ncbi:MAG: alkaline phosphatase family protein [candidate division Zixibacteria bacterium]|nr:alkaline phosphatase family protein [candidate division Zixibacteria bacterium]
MRRLGFFCCLALLSAKPPANAAPPVEKPRLVVLIVIDQFPHHYLTKFEDLFGAGGFKRVMYDGAWMADATYSHLHASTSPGHSVIASGTYGYKTGLIANSWYDRTLNRRRRSLEDPEHLILGMKPNPTGRASTRELVGSSLADELRMATRLRGKAIAVTAKDYSAMISAGKLGTPYWYEAGLGRFTSSSFFMKELPAWVNRFNERKIPDASFGKQWTRLLPQTLYDERMGPDNGVGEEDNRKTGVTFPHTITGGETQPGTGFYNAYKHTPWGNDLVLEFARQAIVEEMLGTDNIPDLLIVGLSSNDYAGHDYGPDSHEVMDITIRTDRQLEAFFAFLDKQTGLKNTLIVLTSDHGVAPLPERIEQYGIQAGRVGAEPLMRRVETALDTLYGEDRWALYLTDTGLYLDYAAIKRRNLRHDEVERVAGAALAADSSIAGVFTRTQIVNGNLPDTPLAKAAIHSFHPDHSGDVIPIARPYYLILDEYSTTDVGTSHGQPHEYDVHVPVLFYGSAIQPGRYTHPIDIADIAPTICHLLGISMPSRRDGRIISEVIR